jgi:deazaflavin-dependent oxidoreductase (nitroreductase family)
MDRAYGEIAFIGGAAMVRKVRDVAPPRRGPLRLLFRSPVWLYRVGLGALLGRRFLLLTHRGRSSGLPRRTVLEIVGRDDTSGGYLVASGYGQRAQWYRNITQDPRTTVQIGRRCWPATARPLSPEESGRALARYARRYPRAAKGLVRLCGYAVDGSEADFHALGAEHIPLVSLDPAPR